jgi:hypothetical protein
VHAETNFPREDVMKRFLLPLFILMIGACASRTAPGQETMSPQPSATGSASAETTIPLVENPGSPPASQREFPLTDFSRSIVDFEEILSGGPQKDGIPAVDDPRYVSIDEADEWIDPAEAVLVIEIEGEARIYPVQILMWHEIVNDTVGGVPVAATYCPLCNSGLAFDRRFDGQVLDFGTSGRLRFSNMVMYDRQSETWWQQAEGRGLVGRYAGATLRQVPMLMVPWEDARKRYEQAKVVSRTTGYSRPYGRNPYTGYDSSAFPFLFRGPEISGDNSPMTRVVAVSNNGATEAFTYPVLQEQKVVNVELGGEPIVVIWRPGTASALDSSSVSGGKDVGSANGFKALVDGRQLTFVAQRDRVIDEETESVWDVTGTAVAGRLKGKSLEPIVSVQHFWFSWTAFEVPTGSSS